jgi:hypothetical protein
MERATTIRMPSTANLMIDSADRNTTNYPSAWDFAIQKQQSIQNGFFTRVGTTEVVMEWCENNIRSDLSNNWVSIDVSGVPHTITIPDGSYTVSRALKYIASAFNDISGTTGKGCVAGSLVQGGFSGILFTPAPPQVLLLTGPLVTSMDFKTFSNSAPGNLAPLTTPGYLFVPDCPDLRLYRYLDIVAPQLTYAQDLKDNSTQTSNRDVLTRWYMAEDVPETLDDLGFPILQGYESFVRRRIFNPPKQIKWDTNLPIGNLTFQVYDQDGNLLPTSDSKSNFLMTLQLSEN